MKRHLLVIALLMIASSCFAEGEVASAAVPRKILLALARDRAAELTEGDALMISRSLLARLQAASSEYILIERPVSAVKASESDLSVEAGKEGADGWVSVTLSGSWSSMGISVRAFDLPTHRTLVDQSFTRADFALGYFPNEPWSDIVRAVAPQYRSALSAAAGSVGSPVALLTIKARPGTRVTGLGAPALEIGADGTASRSLPASREYLLQAEAPGYYRSTSRIFLLADREVTLHQERSAGWSLEASLQDLGYPRVDVTWFPASSNLYLRLGLMTYLVGLSFNSEQAFSSAPLTNVEAQMGVYLNPAGSLFRFSAGIGCLLRVATIPGTYVGLDPLSPWGVRATFGVEVSPDPRSRFFLELTPTAYMTASPDVFAQLLGPGKLPPGWARGNSSFADVLSFRCGYRWML
jgi:hypothetical protein